MYISGVGLEDFETCERLFSISNALARGTRHASAFHQYQAIEEFFLFWDQDKYANLDKYIQLGWASAHWYSGNFLYNNYIQALEILSKERPILAQFKVQFHLEDADFERFLEEERQYLKGLKAPRQYDNEMDIVYVEALEGLEAAE
jgi:hypothetical protein